MQNYKILEKIEKAQIMVSSADHYNNGVTAFNNGSYYEALENFSHMALKDPHYQDAQDTITKISSIFEEEEKERQAEIAKSQANIISGEPYTPVESYKYDNYYPIIISMQDNKGNTLKISDHNGYQGDFQYMKINTGTKLKIGDTLFVRVTAKDPSGRSIQYRFSSNSDRFNDKFGKYSASNEFSYTIGDKDLKTAGGMLRIVVQIKSKKDYYRFNGEYDDETFLDYTLSP